MFQQRLGHRVLAATTFVMGLAASVSALPTITELSGPAPTDQTVGVAVSANGTAATGAVFTATGAHAFRWTALGGLVALDPPSTKGLAISADGSAIVGEAGQRAFVWTSGQGMQDPGIFTGAFLTKATGVSGDGTVVTGFSRGFNSGVGFDTSFRWTALGGLEPLAPMPGGTVSEAAGISGDGLVIVGRGDTASHTSAFRWTAGTGAVDIDDFGEPGGISVALAVNADGTVITGWKQGTTFPPYHPTQAFRWTESGGMARIGVLQGDESSVGRAVNGDGSIVVGMSGSGGGRAFLWTSQVGIVDLNIYLPTQGCDLTGWSLQEATGISADGSAIVGNGFHNGQSRAWIVQGLTYVPPAPCPGNANSDHVVSFADVTAVLANWGATYTFPFAPGDANGDQVVDFSDITAVLANFGALCP